ncbi:MAG TPA: lipopolysaccharide heptosyltransferase I [Burkholderiales bacterium]|nr:lipopolysaccharide heptosyltransferase I [Burkholderiales bacterium]
MPRILLVKTSSLGDVVHNLPVASDIASALPGAQIDWVVEEAFAAIAAAHPAVGRTIPLALRRWRTAWWQHGTRAEVGAFFEALRTAHYDAIVDTQGLIKSAVVTRAARGRRYGFDWWSAREPLPILYDSTFRVPRDSHAVERNRSLAAQALGYAVPARVDYGIRAAHAREDWLPDGRYAVLIHATSARAKLWPEERWIALGQRIAAQGVCCVLPWGSADEFARSRRLAEPIPGAVTAPALKLAAVASLLAGARYAIGVDTGLTHLAVALGVATVGVYSSTDPAKTGLYGSPQAINVGGIGALPDVGQVLHGLDRVVQ